MYSLAFGWGDNNGCSWGTSSRAECPSDLGNWPLNEIPTFDVSFCFFMEWDPPQHVEALGELKTSAGVCACLQAPIISLHCLVEALLLVLNSYSKNSRVCQSSQPLNCFSALRPGRWPSVSKLAQHLVGTKEALPSVPILFRA